MINGHDQIESSDFEKMLADLPECGVMCEISNWFDPLHGIEIQQMVGGNLLARPHFRSSIVMQSAKGPVPIGFEIVATTINEAQRGWKAAAQDAVRDFTEKMRSAQRRIVVPGLVANDMMSPNARP